MQNDVANNQPARQALLDMMQATGQDRDDLDRLLATKGLTEEQLNRAAPGAFARVNAALAKNPSAVAAQDNNALTHVVGEVNRVLDAAQANPNGPGDLDRNNLNWNTIARVGAWANQVPHLKDTAAAVGKMQAITGSAFSDYMKGQKYFTDPSDPENHDKYLQWSRHSRTCLIRTASGRTC